jgi:hypothetical protein
VGARLTAGGAEQEAALARLHELLVRIAWSETRRRGAPMTGTFPGGVGLLLGRLAAVDVFTLDNAYTMFESLRIDHGNPGPFGDHP